MTAGSKGAGGGAKGASVRLVRERVVRMSQPLSLATSSTGMEGVGSPRPHTGSTSCMDVQHYMAHITVTIVTYQVRLIVYDDEKTGIC